MCIFRLTLTGITKTPAEFFKLNLSLEGGLGSATKVHYCYTYRYAVLATLEGNTLACLVLYESSLCMYVCMWFMVMIGVSIVMLCTKVKYFHSFPSRNEFHGSSLSFQIFHSIFIVPIYSYIKFPVKASVLAWLGRTCGSIIPLST